MSTTIDALAIRKRLGRDDWGVPQKFGEDGWKFDTLTAKRGRIIVTNSTAPGETDGADWLHASWSWQTRIPSYDEMTWLHKAVWPNGYAYQVFAPPANHVNIHMYALHLWGKADGSIALPDFGQFGTI